MIQRLPKVPWTHWSSDLFMIIIFRVSIEWGAKNWIAFGTCARGISPEAEFLDVIGTKVSSLLQYSQSPLLTDFTLPPPRSKSGLKLVCNVNITETSSLRTLKIMSRNLNEIVSSWIRLQNWGRKDVYCAVANGETKKTRALWVYPKPSMNVHTTQAIKQRGAGKL